MKCDRCGATVDGTGFLGGRIVCKNCSTIETDHAEARERWHARKTQLAGAMQMLKTESVVVG